MALRQNHALSYIACQSVPGIFPSTPLSPIEVQRSVAPTDTTDLDGSARFAPDKVHELGSGFPCQNTKPTVGGTPTRRVLTYVQDMVAFV